MRHRLIPAAALGAEAVALLESLASEVHRARPNAGWMARKIRREAVLLDRSLVLVDEGRVPVGYALLGHPASLGDTARTAGVGVVAPIRGRGLGTRIVGSVIESARALGAGRLRVLCEPRLAGFYARHGLRPTRERWTLASAGLPTAPKRRLPRCSEDWALGPGVEAASWLPETWGHTPPHERLALGLLDGAGRALMTREGGGWLCQRLELPSPADGDWVRAGAELRAFAEPGTRVFIYGCPALGRGPVALLERGWTVGQRVLVLERPLY